MSIKKMVRNWLLLIGLFWVSSEITYQIYLRSVWINNGRYDWEEYVYNRNKKEIADIKNYFRNSQLNYFFYSRNPDEGDTNALPQNIRTSINTLKKDLTSGVSFNNDCKSFEINFRKIDDTNYIVYINAGPKFKTSYNGYDYSAIITNADSSFRSGYDQTNLAEYFVDRKFNIQYRSKPIILRYGCCSYDLLILKLLRL